MTIEKVVATNRKAYHDYHILEKFEAGMALKGTEVKSLRAANVSLKEAWARIDNGELLLFDMHIAPYEQGNIANHDPRRTRKLLMHKREIMRLLGKTKEKGLTIIPLRVYFSNGRAKMEIALAQGKAVYDKRKAIAERDAKRDIERELGSRRKGR